MGSELEESSLNSKSKLIEESLSFFVGLYCVVFLEHTFLTTIHMDMNCFSQIVFVLCTAIVYPLFYILPAILIGGVIQVVLSLSKVSDSIKLKCFFVPMYFVAGLIIFILYIDSQIFSMFKFHINGFVINLVVTPGGLESMGASATDNFLIALLFLFCIALTVGVKFAADRLKTKFKFSKKIKFSIVVLFILAIGIIATQFAYCSYKNDPTLLANSQKIFLYQPTRMGHLFKRLGIEHSKRTKKVNLSNSDKNLNYPLKPIVFEKPKKPYNIVWLVSESWRWDTLKPDIMPATYEFSKKTLTFHNHYSSGNGTRMALFGMFYGIYGSYFKLALAERKTPVIMDVLKKEGYQFDMFTSAKFTYPEFDKTIFSNIDAKNLHQKNGRGGFKFDRENITDLIKFIKNRDKSRPFMTFMFFESPHAPYTFPDECVVRKDYLKTFNYSTVDVKANIQKIKNRYLNSVNHLDTQLKRVFDFLESEKLLKNTIVVVAGDHGEEFMEKGHWGHNESFHEEQVRTPLLLWVPGVKHKDYNFLSSHLDLSATIAPLIGIKNPAEDFSFGSNLLTGKGKPFYAISSWQRLCYVDDKFKYDISTTANILQPDITTFKDDSVPSAEEKKGLDTGRILNFMKNTSKFLK